MPASVRLHPCSFMNVTSLKAYLLVSREIQRKSQLAQLEARFPEKQLDAKDAQAVFFTGLFLQKISDLNSLLHLKKINLYHLGQSSAL